MEDVKSPNRTDQKALKSKYLKHKDIFFLNHLKCNLKILSKRKQKQINLNFLKFDKGKEVDIFLDLLRDKSFIPNILRSDRLAKQQEPALLTTESLTLIMICIAKTNLLEKILTICQTFL